MWREKNITKISTASDPAQWQLLCSILLPHAWWNMHICPGKLSPKHSLLSGLKAGLVSTPNIWILLQEGTLGSRSDRVARWSSPELLRLKVQQRLDKDLLQFKQE